MLAGDTEIVQAIQTHYAEEKKPAPPAAQPKPVTGQMAPVPAAQAAPAAAVGTQFPRRIGPDSATPAAGTPRAAPYIPPPIPAAAPKPAQKLDEIEPDESISAAAAPPPRPEPVDLPEDDGQMMGLEPIAAHSLTAYKGAVVGFCNPGCRDKFETAVSHFENALMAKAKTPGL